MHQSIGKASFALKRRLRDTRNRDQRAGIPVNEGQEHRELIT